MIQDELMHYGVPGMKWGHRKQYKDSVRSARNRMYVRRDKAENRHENEVLSINRKYKQYGNNFAGKNAHMDKNTKKAYKNEIQKSWDKYSNEHDKATKQFKSDKKASKAEYKQAKAQRKQAIKSTYKEIKKNSTFEEKFTYNNATRRKAAKYVVDNNMSISDAKKKANKDAIRNSAIILGTYGAIHVASLYMNNRR